MSYLVESELGNLIQSDLDIISELIKKVKILMTVDSTTSKGRREYALFEIDSRNVYIEGDKLIYFRKTYTQLMFRFEQGNNVVLERSGQRIEFIILINLKDGASNYVSLEHLRSKAVTLKRKI
ncbi:hypothetical protein RF11_13661 [Thelohanellus kitauei]|uniref:Uncharacterized protein n=1 Tax=Thelohanellus kitauei TaxID=669202 RepID=A0A0C2JRB0_THEKT|nr:hypothetical protein RF11_13661 [Thelohanellus kitauei]